MNERYRMPSPWRWCLRLIMIFVLYSMTGQIYAQTSGGAAAASDELQRQEEMRQFLSAVALAKNNLGATYYVEGLYDSARVHLKDALSIAPDFAAAHLTLGLVYYAQGNKEEAILSFKSAAVGDTVGQRRMGLVHPDTVYAWAKNQLGRMLQGVPKLAGAHTALAILYDEAGYVLDAEKHYLQAIQCDSTYTDAYTNLGKLYTDDERFEEAIRLYEKALNLNLNTNDRAKVDLNIGVAYMGSNNTDKAIQAWRRAIGTNPSYAEAYMNLGIAYQTQNMADSARVFWERSIKANGDFLAPRVALARLAGAEDRFADALAGYKEILNKGVKDPQIYAELGFVYEHMEEYDQALKNYEEALKLDPDDSNINASIRIVKQKQQEQTEARKANKIRARHIVVRQRSAAEEILAQLRNGADFAALARSRSIDPSAADGGDLGYLGAGDVMPAFEEAVMKLNVGEISGVVETPMGFHIIKRLE